MFGRTAGRTVGRTHTCIFITLSTPFKGKKIAVKYIILRFRPPLGTLCTKHKTLKNPLK